MSKKRQSNRPDRRIAPVGAVSPDELQRIEQTASYGGSAYHKLHPGDYKLDPPFSPRLSKSVCDDRRIVLKAEAAALLKAGIRKGMVSRPNPGQLPKYVWSVDADGEVYEAKTAPDRGDPYHGYRLGEDEGQMRDFIKAEWNKR